MGTTKWGARGMGEMVLNAGCPCLATSHTRPWDHGAELAPREAAGQPPPQDAGAKASGSLVLCWLLQLMEDPSCAKEAQGTAALRQDQVTPLKQAPTLQGNIQGCNQESLGSLPMLGHWLWYSGLIFQNHMAWSQALLGPALVGKSSRNRGIWNVPVTHVSERLICFVATTDNSNYSSDLLDLPGTTSLTLSLCFGLLLLDS